MAINQLKAGAALSYVSIIINNIVGLLYTPIMLRMMGTSEYGLYSLVASVVASLTILDLGFGNAIIRYTAKFRAEGKQEEQYNMFGMFILLYSIVSIIAFTIGLLLYYNIDSLFDRTMTVDEIGKIRIMMLLMVFNIAFTFPMSIWGSIIQAYENFVFQKMVIIIRIILNPVVMIVLLTIGYRAIGMVVLTTLLNITTLTVNWWYCKHKLKIKVHFKKFKWSFLKEIGAYSFWIFLNAIMDLIYWSTGQFILGMYVGSAAIAIYAVSVKLQGIFMSFASAISGVFLPRVTSMITKKHNEAEISSLFIKTGRIQFFIMAFILTGFILFGKPFIILWAGPTYEDAYYISLLFFIPIVVPLIQSLGITILQARNQLKFRSTSCISIAVACLFISIPLAKTHGPIGYTIGTSLAIIIGQIIVMNIYYYKKIHLNIPLFWKEIAKMSIVPALVGVLTFWCIHTMDLTTIKSLASSIALFTLVYLPLAWFGSMNKSERLLFKRPIVMLLSKIR
ncbi:MAG: oligosaccharide flippase family protein [Bacteroidaceae bacterium]|nr:oligosaccharide flippase family protein [Bacteroidaceae bacterium]